MKHRLKVAIYEECDLLRTETLKSKTVVQA
jgi:hypothetical protein